jgi:O-antigen/teichoic acid export membrane protein
VVRVLSVPLTFLFVRSPGDLPVAAAIYAATPVVVGLTCLIMLIRERALEPLVPSRPELVAAFKDGWPLFLSNASMSLYTTTNTALLGIVAGPLAVGYYSAAERLTGAAQGLLAPINQTLYPRVSRLMHESRPDAYALIRRALRNMGAFTLTLSTLLFVLAPYLVDIVYGSRYQPAVTVLRWLAPLPFVIGLSNVFGLHTMLPLGMKSTFSRIVLFAGPLNVVLLLVLAGVYSAPGAACAVLITETAVTLAMAFTLWRVDVPIFRNQVLA